MSTGEVLLESRPQPSQLYRWMVLIFVSLASSAITTSTTALIHWRRIFLDQLGFLRIEVRMAELQLQCCGRADAAHRRNPH